MVAEDDEEGLLADEHVAADAGPTSGSQVASRPSEGEEHKRGALANLKSAMARWRRKPGVGEEEGAGAGAAGQKAHGYGVGEPGQGEAGDARVAHLLQQQEQLQQLAAVSRSGERTRGRSGHRMGAVSDAGAGAGSHRAGAVADEPARSPRGAPAPVGSSPSAAAAGAAPASARARSQDGAVPTGPASSSHGVGALGSSLGYGGHVAGVGNGSGSGGRLNESMESNKADLNKTFKIRGGHSLRTSLSQGRLGGMGAVSPVSRGPSRRESVEWEGAAVRVSGTGSMAGQYVSGRASGTGSGTMGGPVGHAAGPGSTTNPHGGSTGVATSAGPSGKWGTRDAPSSSSVTAPTAPAPAAPGVSGAGASSTAAAAPGGAHTGARAAVRQGSGQRRQRMGLNSGERDSGARASGDGCSPLLLDVGALPGSRF